MTTKEKGKKVAMYSIHANPCNSFEFCVGGRDHYIRIYDKRKIVEVSTMRLGSQIFSHILLERMSILYELSCHMASMRERSGSVVECLTHD